MTHSESIASLAPALVAAQAEMEHAHKNAANPHFRSTYANLAEVIDTVRPVLEKHGLAVVQLPGFRDGTVTLETMLVHKSGEWIRGEAGAPIGIQFGKDGRELPPNPQGVGSAVTYLRRYSLAALCGITQEDDDGESASGRGQNGNGRQEPKQNGNGSKKATQKQIELIDKLSASHVFTDNERAGIVDKLNGATTEDAAKIIDWMQKQIDKRKAAEKETANV